MISRTLEPKIKSLAKKLPVIGLIGPRQSGKTTLAKKIFKNHKYISLEDLKAREFFKEDPHGFFEFYKNKNGIILDEIQEVPDILSYVQVYSDKYNKSGYFVLTGSQNFLVLEAITQTLAGRIALFTLLPLSISELTKGKLLPKNIDRLIFNGLYPRIYDKKLSPLDWYPTYIKTYLERDIRTIKNISDLNLFQKFIGLCAGRTGQLLNISALANDCGITQITAKSWLGLLEASFVIFFLQPYHKNISTRLVKTPKLFFYDTGIVCSLLGIESWEQVTTHYLRGGLFESLVVCELFKQRYNRGLNPNFYFWRDKSGNEVDCIMVSGDKLTPIEIKAGQSISSNYFDGIKYLHELLEKDVKPGYIVYGGEENQKRLSGNVLSWKNIDEIVKKVLPNKEE